MVTFYVYRYTCPVRNEVIYIGKGTGRRAMQHLKRQDQHPLTNRIKWLRKQGLEPVIDFICQDVDEEFAFLVEHEAIAKYGRKDIGKGPLLNLTDGGEGGSGMKLAPEVIARRNAAISAAKSSVEGRKRMSETTKQLYATTNLALKTSVKWTEERKKAHSEKVKLAWERRKAYPHGR